MTQGNCVGQDSEQFHSDYGQSMLKVAEAQCTGCPVINTCLEYAMDRMWLGSENDPDGYAIGRYGVWGGTTPAQRDRLLRKRRAAA
jgi:hypothetical protein